MKKSIVALVGLFTLIACSEDSYQEADKMSESGTIAVENIGPQNSVKSDAAGYISPWNTHNKYQFTHIISNHTDNVSPAAKLKLVFTAYIGTAYYDGAQDGELHDPAYMTMAPSSGAYSWMWHPSYSYLHPNGFEYGSVWDAKPIVMGSTDTDVRDLSIYGEGYCQTGHGIVDPIVNPRGEYFDTYHHSGIGGYMLTYGKVMYYLIEAYDLSNNLIYKGYVAPLQAPGINLSEWVDEGIVDNNAGFPMLVHNDPSNGSVNTWQGQIDGSREVMPYAPSLHNPINFTHPVTGFNYRIFTNTNHLLGPGGVPSGSNIAAIQIGVASF